MPVNPFVKKRQELMKQLETRIKEAQKETYLTVEEKTKIFAQFAIEKGLKLKTVREYYTVLKAAELV